MKDEKYSSSRMVHEFHDEDMSTSYDKIIKSTRDKMEKCSPCDALDAINALTAQLKQIRETYYLRPCKEGFCMGLFTPHTERIDRRIRAFQDERKVHEEDCNRYLKKEKQMNEKQLRLEIRGLELESELKKYSLKKQ